MFKRYILLFLFTILLCPIFVLAIDKVDINNASLSQLDIITGIGPAMAQRIIDARPFSSIDDLDRVKGIGETTLQKIKTQGVACVGCTTSIEATESQAKTQTPDIAPTPTPETITYPSGMFINEILPNPEGTDENNEWVELYNSNNIDIDLSGWQIQDTNGTPKTFTILKDTKILANGFLVLKRPDTKIMLNNDTDGLNLLSPNKKIVDSMKYTKAPLGQSYNKTPSGWAWSTTLTAGVPNIISGIKTLSKTKNSANNDLSSQGLADISLSKSLNINQDINKDSPWFLFFIVLAITIILATTVLLVKTKLHKT